MNRQNVSKKTSSQHLSTPISKDIAPSPSYGSLSGVVQRVQQDASSVSEDERQQLESAIGSRAYGEILAGKQTPWAPEFVGISGQLDAPIQAKLTIGAVGDKYEQEADRVAKDVVQRINIPQTNQMQVEQGSQTQSDTLQREEVGREEELQLKHKSEGIQRNQQPKIVQRRESNDRGEVSTDLEGAIKSAKSGGQPLDAGLQQSMGQAMGADFSGVRVHTDPQAHLLNQSLQAKAFTTGQDVFFCQGEYNPGSRSGQELIAHELTHVVQQKGRQMVGDQKTRNGGSLRKSSEPTKDLQHPNLAGTIYRNSPYIHSTTEKTLTGYASIAGYKITGPVVQREERRTESFRRYRDRDRDEWRKDMEIIDSPSESCYVHLSRSISNDPGDQLTYRAKADTMKQQGLTVLDTDNNKATRVDLIQHGIHPRQRFTPENNAHITLEGRYCEVLLTLTDRGGYDNRESVKIGPPVTANYANLNFGAATNGRAAMTNRTIFDFIEQTGERAKTRLKFVSEEEMSALKGKDGKILEGRKQEAKNTMGLFRERANAVKEVINTTREMTQHLIDTTPSLRGLNQLIHYNGAEWPELPNHT